MGDMIRLLSIITVFTMGSARIRLRWELLVMTVAVMDWSLGLRLQHANLFET